MSKTGENIFHNKEIVTTAFDIQKLTEKLKFSKIPNKIETHSRLIKSTSALNLKQNYSNNNKMHHKLRSGIKTWKMSKTN